MALVIGLPLSVLLLLLFLSCSVSVECGVSQGSVLGVICVGPEV